MCQKLKSKIKIKDCCVFTTTSPIEAVRQCFSWTEHDGSVYITGASDTVTVGGQHRPEVCFQRTQAGVNIFNRI